MVRVFSRKQKEDLILPAGGRAPDLRRGSIFFIGTATVILRYAGFTILTDPNFLHQGEQVHLGYGIRSTRQTNPAMDIEQLPAVDLVVLSHLHEDHFDRLVARKLDRTLPIVTTGQAARALSKMGFTATYPLNVWQTLTVRKGDIVLSITSTPAKHAAGPLSYLLPSVMGSMLDFQTARDQLLLRLYITGDTILYDDLKDIPRRYPDIDLGLFHLGGTRVFGVWLTMNGKQGVEALKIINPQRAIPIHYNDYTVFKSRLPDFMKRVEKAGRRQQVRYLRHGETYTFELPARK